jgi:hypothetical protein
MNTSPSCNLNSLLIIQVYQFTISTPSISTGKYLRESNRKLEKIPQYASELMLHTRYFQDEETEKHKRRGTCDRQTQCSLENMNARDRFEDLGADWRIILKLI